MHAYVDGELDSVNAIAVDQQIAADPELARERARIEALRQVLREKLPAPDLPPGLEHRIQKAIGIARSNATVSWRAMAASIMLAMVASSGVTWFATRSAAPDEVVEAVVAGHLRSLIASQPTDVVSSDGHTVKPWFNGKTAQAPRLVDLTQDGFKLIGGRVDVVSRTGVPTVVYQIRQHLVSVTAIPDAQNAMPPEASTVRGYNIIRWADGDTSYMAVSDLNAAELARFAQEFRNSAPVK
jgi:anti-sigma factor RsiW